MRKSIVTSTGPSEGRRGVFKAGWLGLVALMVLCQLVLAACGDATPTTSSATTVAATTAAGATTTSAANTTAAATATTAAAATGSVVTLNFGWWSNGPTKDQAFRAWLDSFESTHPNIKIKSEILPWANYWDKVTTTVAAGNAYDLIGVCSCQAGPFFDNGQFLDLSQFADLKETTANLQAQPVATFNWNNKQYGLPLGIALSVLGYNKDLFKAAAVDLPDPVKPMAFEDFKAMAHKLTKMDNGKVTQYALNPGNSRLGWMTWVTSAGGAAFDNYVNPTKVTVNTPEGIAGLRAYQSLVQEKLIPPADEQGGAAWGDTGLSSLQTNKVAMTELGPWEFSDIATKSLPYGVAPFPMIKQQAIRATANGMSIYKGTKNPKEAWEFLKWATASANQVSFAKFSDIPVDNTAFSQLNTIIAPKEFAVTLQSQLAGFKPYLLTPKAQLEQTLNDIINDMARGKYTPEQAAAELEKQGNAILGSK